MAITYSQHANLTDADLHALTRWTVADSAARLALSPVSTDNDKLCKQLDNGSYWILSDWSGPTWTEFTSVGVAAVTSVFGQIGDVDETDANFTASQIANVAAGDIAATDVQAALNELDADKAPATHTHVLSQITDSGTAAGLDVGTALTNIPQLEDVGGGTPGLPAVDGSQLTGVAGGGSAITVTDEGGAPLTSDVQSFDFVGAGVTATNVGDDVTITIAPGSAPIDTVFARTGTVVATASDYDASQIDNDSAVTGAFVDDALNTLSTDKAETTDTRFPTANEKGALAGTGAPSGSNRYVVDNDSRVVNAVQGPASATANALARFDQATGKLVKNSIITLDDGAPNQSMNWNNGPTSTVISSTTINCENVIVGAALRTEADHVQYGVAAPAVVDQANRGIWWVEDQTTTTKPHFREGDGTDHNLLTPEGANILATGVTDTTLALKPDGAGGAEWVAESGGGGGSALTVEDDGTPLTTNATKLNFAGAVVVTEPVADEITVTVTPGSAPVASVFGEVGAVVAAASHYDASQIDNDATNANGNVTGAFVSSALDTADAAIEANTTATAAAQADADAAQDDATSAKAKTDFLTVTGSVNLDTVLSDTTTNNAKRSYPVADEALVDGHEATLANVAVPITTAGAALLDDANNVAQRTTLGLGSAALGTVGTTIGDIVELVNVGGNPGFPTLRGDNLVGIPTGAETFIELTDVTEPDYIGHAGQFVKVNAGATGLEFDTVPGGGDLLSTNNLNDVANATTATQNLGVEVGVDVAAFGHTHDVLSNVDNTAGNGVILGRDTAGNGDSEELTPAEARGVIGVSIENIGPGVHSKLEQAVPDAGAIFASLQTGQIAALTLETVAAGDHILIEDASAANAKKRILASDLLGGGSSSFSSITGVPEDNANISVFGASLIDDADAAAAIATLGIDADIATLTIGASATVTGSNTGDQTITLTADVTGSGTGSFAATIADDAVTYAKMQNVVADNVLLGNNSGAGGIVDELTATEVRALLGIPTHTKSITIPDPASGEIWDMWTPPEAITITGISYHCRGTTPSIPFNVAHGTDPTSLADIDSTGWTATNTTSIIVDTTFSGGDLAVAANETIAVDITGAVTGTDPILHVDVRYTVN